MRVHWLLDENCYCPWLSNRHTLEWDPLKLQGVVVKKRQGGGKGGDSPGGKEYYLNRYTRKKSGISGFIIHSFMLIHSILFHHPLIAL